MRRWMCVAVFFGLAATPSFAQPIDDLKGADRQLYEDLKREDGSDDPASEKAVRVFQQKARFLIGRLSEPGAENRMSTLILELIRELPIQKPGDAPQKMSERRRKFVAEFGKQLVVEIDKALKSPKVAVKVNAARALSVVALMGYDGVAPVAVRLIKDPAERLDVKNWALVTLQNILAFVADPNSPDLSVFTANKSRPLEQDAVQALCEYVLQSRKVEGLKAEEIAAIRYVRRQAVRALGFTRGNRVRFQGQVLAKPGWVLLKVANNDGISPPAELSERTEAVGSYLQLFPLMQANADRDVRCDVAAHLIGAAMLDIAKMKMTLAPDDKPIVWRATAERWEAGLEQWAKNATDMRLEGASAVAALAKQAKTDLIDPLKSRQEGAQPDTARFRAWLLDPANTPKGPLFKEDGDSQVKIVDGL